MNKPKIRFLIFTFLTVGLFGSTFSFAQADSKPQQQAEPSYEVVLQILTASNVAADNKSVPQTLSGVVRKLKTIYPFSNYQLILTYLQRTVNTGDAQFSGVSSAAGQNQENYAPVFSEWTIGQLRSLLNERGQNSIQLQNFRFGQRVPIRTASNVVNYEQIGLKMTKLSLPENTPTVIGSLSTSKADELMFLVLTVKPTD